MRMVDARAPSRGAGLRHDRFAVVGLFRDARPRPDRCWLVFRRSFTHRNRRSRPFPENRLAK